MMVLVKQTVRPIDCTPTALLRLRYRQVHTLQLNFDIKSKLHKQSFILYIGSRDSAAKRFEQLSADADLSGIRNTKYAL